MLLTVAPLDAADLQVLTLIEEQHRILRPLVAAPRRWSGLLRRVALARAVRGSNTIEGFTVTVDDAFAALDDQEPLDANEVAWHAVRGYRDAMTYVLQVAQDKSRAITAETLLALHFMMQQYDLSKWPGRLRPDDVYVYDEDNQVTVYVGPDASEVPGLIGELVDELNSADSVPVLVRAAMAHLNLVMIHPFKDGNGRMARCLQTLILACSGTFAAPEFVSIEEYLGRNEQDYYRVLAEVGGGSWNPGADTKPWIRFCLTAHFRQVQRVVRRADFAARVWIRAEEEISAAGLPDRCVQPLAFCMSGRLLRNSTYRQLTDGLTQNVASRDLTELAKVGLLEPRGEKRGRHYVPSARLRAIASEAGAETGARLPHELDPYEMAPT